MLGTAGQTPGALSLPPPGTLRGLYAWLDRLPLSRPKRHLARDFSDGVMLAEIVKHFHPRLVDLHNYTPTCNTDQKLSNWHVLNRKVLHKLSFYVSETDIRKVVANRPGAIEPILCALREKIESGAAHIDLRAATSAGSGPFGVDTLQPQVDLATNTHTGRPRSMALSSRKTTQDGSAPGKLGHCACGGWVSVSPTFCPAPSVSPTFCHAPMPCLLSLPSSLGLQTSGLFQLGPSWRALGASRPQDPAAFGGTGTGTGCPAGNGQGTGIPGCWTPMRFCR
ncbi:uncharacterized protein LOC128582110 isoform X6 [Nycticebus coucang]|uniref:uncharacterized protein LOC128582110 isoform X6 n=1 Tax=Nycticebus coucang TaxID=9470 RepID=UPI00234C4DCA|nr:uncharacterized protein LOC128582110 isoform X6 [Nycticebus coucang]